MSASIIADRYVIRERLGSGGMGDVYRAIDQSTNTPVAVKLLRPELATPEMVTRFTREGDTLRRLNHPNIVKLLDSIFEHGQYYLVMELVDGGTLDEILQQTPRLPINQILNVALDLADALTRAHRLNVIHRDIKPANVLMTRDGMPRLTDFGIARVIGSDLTETGSVLGTVSYLAPEVLQGAQVDARADIWALGLMLFEMLAGEHPFRAQTQHPGGFIYAILNAPLPDLESLRPDAPTALIDLVLRMLSRNLAERIPRMRLVGAELEAIIDTWTTTPSPAQAVDTRQTAPIMIAREVSRFATPSTPSASTDSPVKLPNNLPVQITPFVGREAELDALAQLLGDHALHLLTIVAQGGMGKTRLALETAGRVLQSEIGSTLFENGIYFIDLAPIGSADHIVGVIAEAVGYAFQQDDRTQARQLLDFLRQKKMLLLMDNFEHVLDGRALMQEILQSAPDVKILVTSREKLNLNAETVYVLGGMDFPNWETPDDALDYSAVKLFMQSAHRVRSDFRLEADDLTYVARICRAAQGTPLAILLAAAWLEVLTPREIADEISRSLDFLESEMHDLPERQRSLRAVFEYSWNLLGDPERMLFAQLSMFRGGFTRDAAMAVTGANLRALTLLVNKSLLHRDQESGRYEIHELLRQYAAEKLGQSEDFAASRDAHSRYYTALVAQLTPRIKGFGQQEALALIDAEFENIRFAWNWAVSQQNADAVARAVEGLTLFLTYRNRTMDGEQMFAAARQVWRADLPDPSALAGVLLVRFPEGQPLERYRRGLEIAQYYGDAAEIAFCKRLIGHWLSHTEYNQADGIPLLHAAFEDYDALGDKFYAAQVLDDLGWSYNLTIDPDKQAYYAGRGLELRREIGDKIGTANSLRNVGGGSGGFLDLANHAFTYWAEAKQLAYEVNDRLGIAWNAILQAANLVFLGDFEQAETLIDEGYPHAADLNDPVVKGFALMLRGAIAGLRDENYAETKRLIDEGFPPGTQPNLQVTALMFSVAIVAFGLQDMSILPPYFSTLLKLSPFDTDDYFTPIFFPCYLLELSGEERYLDVIRLLSAFFTNTISFVGYPMPIGWAKRWAALSRLQAQAEAAVDVEAARAAREQGIQVSGYELRRLMHSFLQKYAS